MLRVVLFSIGMRIVRFSIRMRVVRFSIRMRVVRFSLRRDKGGKQIVHFFHELCF